jgi:chemotaxis protein CheD
VIHWLPWPLRSQNSKLADVEVSVVPSSLPSGGAGSSGIISVAIGQWVVAQAPARVRTLLGSCVAVILHDRVVRLGGLAHIVLPDSRGSTQHPGKFADTAIPGMIGDMERQLQVKMRGRLVAKLVGGASMFPSNGPPNAALNIGQMNQEAVERILGELMIPILARDLGGGSGRHLTLDTASGIVAIKIPGGGEYEL